MDIERKILDIKLMDTKKLEDVFKKIEEDGVEFLLAQYVDINGASKVKQVPSQYLKDLVEEGAGFAGAAVHGMGQGPHNHDLMARVDLDTYRKIPWRSNVGFLTSNIHVDNEPWPCCSRVNLIRMIDIFKEEGFVLNGGFEPEFFLVQRNSSGKIETWDPLGIDVQKKPCYDYRGISQAMDLLQEMINYGNKMGFEIYQSDHEDANGQYEINFSWTNILHASDKLVLFRMMANQVAAKHNAICTFMGKPFDDRSGSGAHLHFHVADAETGENPFSY
jgi:glutamine synthetase